MICINSYDNRIFKQLKKLARRAHRDKTGLFIAEGERLVQDAVCAGVVEYLVMDEEHPDGPPHDLPCYRMRSQMFREICDTATPQGILAVCSKGKMQGAEHDGESGLLSSLESAGFALVCDGISDPGNLGTILRTAECAGAGLVVLCGNCVDLYNPKTVRATMGSLFRLPVLGEDTLEALHAAKFRFVVSTLDAAVDLYDADLSGKIALVVGNEANGVSETMVAKADLRVKIPMDGKADSLNAAAAAAIIMFEIKRRLR